MAGCGDGSGGSGDVETMRPERAFAPLVVFDRAERLLPVDARWFVDRSTLWFADDEGCGDRRVASGRVLTARAGSDQVPLIIEALGRRAPSYWRESRDGSCEPRNNARHYADEHTRPHSTGQRTTHLRLAEGYYLDLADSARRGFVPTSDNEQVRLDAPTYWERRAIEIDGQPGLRVSYWLLFGAHRPPDATGRPSAAFTHEGDWERVDVDLAGEGGSYEPVRVRLNGPHSGTRRVRWGALRLSSADSGAHPVLYAARDSHTLYPRPGTRWTKIDVDGETVELADHVPDSCEDCPRMRTWEHLHEATLEPWYGFGGAWGEIGPSDETTGPLGPHGRWVQTDFEGR